MSPCSWSQFSLFSNNWTNNFAGVYVTTDAQVSKETQVEALKIAKGIQRPGQTKEQTKLIAQGIEKGISEYKKIQKGKARERDKQRKKELKAASRSIDEAIEPLEKLPNRFLTFLPWALLLATCSYLIVTSIG